MGINKIGSEQYEVSLDKITANTLTITFWYKVSLHWLPDTINWNVVVVSVDVNGLDIALLVKEVLGDQLKFISESFIEGKPIWDKSYRHL